MKWTEIARTTNDCVLYMNEDAFMNTDGGMVLHLKQKIWLRLQWHDIAGQYTNQVRLTVLGVILSYDQLKAIASGVGTYGAFLELEITELARAYATQGNSLQLYSDWQSGSSTKVVSLAAPLIGKQWVRERGDVLPFHIPYMTWQEKLYIPSQFEAWVIEGFEIAPENQFVSKDIKPIM